MTAVHENVLSATVSVEVAKDSELSLLGKIDDHLLRVVDRRVEDFARRFPPTIQITPSERAAIITVYHTVWVEHRDDFENKVLP